MFIFDYHVHTNYSPDSDSSLKSILDSAISKGVEQICITDHVDNPNVTFFDIPDYNNFLIELSKYREIYKDKLKILFGCELSLAPYLNDEVKKVVSQYNFDFIIGSSHEVRRNFLAPGTNFYADKDKDTAFNIYFEEILENINIIKDFDVYGHLDYIYRYSHYEDNTLTYNKYKDIIDEILKALVLNNKGLEINCSGFRYNLNAFHPSSDILKRFKSLGGEIVTIGSDAHSPEYVASNFKNALEHLKSSNFSYVTTFENRKPTFHKL